MIQRITEFYVNHFNYRRSPTIWFLVQYANRVKFKVMVPSISYFDHFLFCFSPHKMLTSKFLILFDLANVTLRTLLARNFGDLIRTLTCRCFVFELWNNIQVDFVLKLEWKLSVLSGVVGWNCHLVFNYPFLCCKSNISTNEIALLCSTSNLNWRLD